MKVRSEADELLLRHAAAESVRVFEDTRVESLEFKDRGDPATSRPISANWTRKSGESGSINFSYLVDASGRQGIMATKYLKHRVIREALRNVAVYGYWTDVAIFDEGGPRSNAPLFECLSGQCGVDASRPYLSADDPQTNSAGRGQSPCTMGRRPSVWSCTRITQSERSERAASRWKNTTANSCAWRPG